jgi:hypothetical protein
MIRCVGSKQCTYKPNIQVHLRIHYRSGKALKYCITYSGCVYSLSYPACNKHAPYYVVIYDLSAFIIFSHYVINGTNLGRNFLNIKFMYTYVPAGALTLKILRYTVLVSTQHFLNHFKTSSEIHLKNTGYNIWLKHV